MIHVIICCLYICNQCSTTLTLWLRLPSMVSFIQNVVPLTDLAFVHCCACPKSGPGFVIPYVVDLFSFTVVCGCSLCWYWWIVDHHCRSSYTLNSSVDLQHDYGFRWVIRFLIHHIKKINISMASKTNKANFYHKITRLF